MADTAIVGAILGTAVGDALGFVYEGLSSRRGLVVYGEPDRYRFCFGRGAVSDDTEHTCIVAQALIASAGDPDLFSRELARRLRWWLLGLPAGIGRATLRAIVKLWCGYSPATSGVFSAGNGPAMRSAVLGAAIDDPDLLRSLVRISTRITHTDPKAEYGALAVAAAARMARRETPIDGTRFLEELRSLLPAGAAEEFVPLVERAVGSAMTGQSAPEFVESQGWRGGVSGYVYQTVPVALHVWLRHQRDFATAVVEAIRCGGDTDTTAAIVGGIVGTAVGKAGIPQPWLAGLLEWPRSAAWMEDLGHCLSRVLVEKRPQPPPGLSALALLARNLLFLAVVLCHLFRRCLPPY